ncbi:hypothetical protein ACQWFZ_25705, partial [Salmonella enterica subsp. enterica serovar Infantis]
VLSAGGVPGGGVFMGGLVVWGVGGYTGFIAGGDKKGGVYFLFVGRLLNIFMIWVNPLGG